MDKNDSYSGECLDEKNTLSIKFNKDWLLTFEFVKEKKETSKRRYFLETVQFKYVLHSDEFPDAYDKSKNKLIEKKNMKEFSSIIESSYKCFSLTKIDLVDFDSDEVILNFNNYQSQAFMESETSKFNTGKYIHTSF